MNIDFDRLRLLLQPFRLRAAELLQSLLKACFASLSGLKSTHDAFAQDVSRRLSYDCSVKNLRRAIADAAGCDYTDVTISDSADTGALMLYADSLTAPVTLDNTDPETLYSDDMLYYSNDFSVTVPAGFIYKSSVISSVIDRYKRAGTHYNLNFN